MSLVHCTAVTYSHSLTHIYSSSIIGPHSDHSWSPKEWVKDKATCSRWPTAVGPVWSAVGDYVAPLSCADTQPYMYHRVDEDHSWIGLGGAHRDLFSPLFWVSWMGMCRKTSTAALPWYINTAHHHGVKQSRRAEGETSFLLVSQQRI